MEDNVSPGSYPPVSELQLPAPDSPKRLGTKTAFDIPTAIIHPPWNTLEALVGSLVPSILPSILPSVLPSILPSTRDLPEVEKRDTEGVAYHKVFRQEQLPYAEINQQTEYGNWYDDSFRTIFYAFFSQASHVSGKHGLDEVDALLCGLCSSPYYHISTAGRY